MIAVIDYDAGNIRSVLNAFSRLGAEAVLTDSREMILSADHVVLPGVGAFGDAMGKLRSRGLEQVICETAERGIPLLGICLGQQLLFESSEESPGVRGLGILKGSCRRIPELGQGKIPQIGWNDLRYPEENPRGRLFREIPEGQFVYFVHSFYTDAQERSVVRAVTHYGVEIPASVEKDNVFACQFHPEKSAEVGMRILRSFLETGSGED